MHWLNFTLATLGTYRISRLIVAEAGPFAVFEVLRVWLSERYAADHWLNKGIACPLCVSFWIAAVFALFVATDNMDFILNWMGIAGAVTLIFMRLES